MILSSLRNCLLKQTAQHEVSVQAGFAIGSPSSHDAGLDTPRSTRGYSTIGRHKRPNQDILGYRRLGCDVELFCLLAPL